MTRSPLQTLSTHGAVSFLIQYRFMWLSLVVGAITYVFHSELLNRLFPSGYAIELLDADSLGYLEFSRIRTAGYPVFLWVIQSLFGTYEAAPAVQSAIFALSVGFLATQVSRLFRSSLAATIVMGCLLLNPDIMKYHFKILTESLSLALLCLYFAFIARYLLTRRARNIAFAGLISGAAVLVRPINYTWAAGMLLLIFIAWRYDKRSISKAALVGMLPYGAVIALGALAFFVKHGEFKTQSFLGFNLHGKALFYVDSSVPTRAPNYMAYMAREITPIREAVLTCSTLQCRYSLSARVYDHIRWARSIVNNPAYRAALDADFGSGYVVNDDFYMARALEVIRAKPRPFLEDFALHAYSLWVVLQIKTPHERDVLADVVRRYRDVFADKGEILNHTHASRVLPAPVVYLIRAGLIGLFVASLFAMCAGLFERRDASSGWRNCVRFLAIAGVVIHAGYLGTALIQAGFPRYALDFSVCLYIYAAAIASSLWRSTAAVRWALGRAPVAAP